MKKPKTTRMYEIRFTVIGTGAFPLDMLRYDECFPENEGQSRAMLEEEEQRVVELVRRTAANPMPTFRRWESFGWRVLKIQTERFGEWEDVSYLRIS